MTNNADSTKFGDLAEIARLRKEPPSKPVTQSTEAVVPVQEVLEGAQAEQAIKGRGGRRSDPNYRQALAYINKDIDKEVRRRLLDDKRDYSELVEDLLRGWLNS